MKDNSVDRLPTVSELEVELDRVKQKKQQRYLITKVVVLFVSILSVSVLLATFVFPVLKIYGNSMSPTLREGNIVVALNSDNIERGDIIAFYSNNKILTKRVIGITGDFINIDQNGDVFVNERLLNEDYLSEKYLGKSDVQFPIQVPEGSYFVLGDNRETSIDSRHSKVGCIDQQQVIGKLVFKVWPFIDLGLVR